MRHSGSGIQPTFHQLPLLKATPYSSLYHSFPAPVNVWTHCLKNNIDICPNFLALQRQSKNRKTRYEIHFMVNTLDPCSNLCIANNKHYKAGESTQCTSVVFFASTRTRAPSIEPTGNKREGGVREVLVTNPEGLSSISRIHIVGETLVPQIVFLLLQ